MGDDGWRRMVCVESGNARENGVVIAPGGAHRLAVHYDVASQVRSTGERCAGT
jgi:D-hexose-6-phosphate mutarotase